MDTRSVMRVFCVMKKTPLMQLDVQNLKETHESINGQEIFRVFPWGFFLFNRAVITDYRTINE